MLSGQISVGAMLARSVQSSLDPANAFGVAGCAVGGVSGCMVGKVDGCIAGKSAGIVESLVVKTDCKVMGGSEASG